MMVMGAMGKTDNNNHGLGNYDDDNLAEKTVIVMIFLITITMDLILIVKTIIKMNT